MSTSGNGSAGTVWTFAKSANGTDVLHFINLLGNTSNAWTDSDGACSTPPVRQNATVKHYYGAGTPTTVNFASPDINGGDSQRLSCTTGSDGQGNYLQFTIPQLNY